MHSKEYENMIKANELTFDAVDKAKNNEVTAQCVDYCNYKRYIDKQDFQKKFFDCELKEQKLLNEFKDKEIVLLKRIIELMEAKNEVTT